MCLLQEVIDDRAKLDMPISIWFSYSSETCFVMSLSRDEFHSLPFLAFLLSVLGLP